MNTEITEYKLNGWVLYDAECSLCTSMARRFRGLLAGKKLTLLPLQTPWVKARLALPDSQWLAEMRLMRPDGKLFGGADALLEISRYFWWTWPLRQMAHISIVKALIRKGYRHIARNRKCINGRCEIKSQSRVVDLLPLAVLPVFALIFRANCAPWIFMWALAFALYFGCKWLTYREATRHGIRPTLPCALCYLFAWPGMDATNFLDAQNVSAKSRKIEWGFAFFKIILGVILVWVIARRFLPAYPLLSGWTGMAGVVFILHFGLFHLLSLAWRRAGICATPLMQNPIGAQSLTEFWGKRWNTAFNELAFRFTFRPLRRLTSPVLATLAVFGLSGLIHDLLISLPARNGYGLPTLYFLAQGLGVILERSQFGIRIGLGRGMRGWIFTLFVTTAPVYCLFHPPFIRNIILPMLTAIGAT